MSDTNEDKSIIPRKVGAPTKYTDELWIKAQDLVEHHPEKTLTQIAKEIGIPLTTLESRAVRYGWLNTRDLSSVRKADESLKKLNREVALQINDLHKHTIAMIEALQYSHRIKIVRDEEGGIHYINFEDWPDKPPNWEELSDVEKEAHLRFISPSRYKAFTSELNLILERKMGTVSFISKNTKASLPKVDENLVDVSSRDDENKIIDNTNIFVNKKKKAIDELLEKIEENDNE